ncbi:MAG TPA: DUF5658 family protein [Vicinamibacterales bacterium]|jgi:hypothetical protein|nr:DUF5658 family protein [Vicinamibacterales bacterium]
MARLYQPWDPAHRRFGDIAVVTFLCVQFLDGAFTYFGVRIWGPAIEGNPLISSAVAFAGLGLGLAGTKLVAIAFGMVLHLKRIHTLIALLTAFYLCVAILPWAILFLS